MRRSWALGEELEGEGSGGKDKDAGISQPGGGGEGAGRGEGGRGGEVGGEEGGRGGEGGGGEEGEEEGDAGVVLEKGGKDERGGKEETEEEALRGEVQETRKDEGAVEFGEEGIETNPIEEDKGFRADSLEGVEETEDDDEEPEEEDEEDTPFFVGAGNAVIWDGLKCEGVEEDIEGVVGAGGARSSKESGLTIRVEAIPPRKRGGGALARTVLS